MHVRAKDPQKPVPRARRAPLFVDGKNVNLIGAEPVEISDTDPDRAYYRRLVALGELVEVPAAGAAAQPKEK